MTEILCVKAKSTKFSMAITGTKIAPPKKIRSCPSKLTQACVRLKREDKISLSALQ
jgi:hypothetical protein